MANGERVNVGITNDCCWKWSMSEGRTKRTWLNKWIDELISKFLSTANINEGQKLSRLHRQMTRGVAATYSCFIHVRAYISSCVGSHPNSDPSHLLNPVVASQVAFYSLIGKCILLCRDPHFKRYSEGCFPFSSHVTSFHSLWTK